MNLVACLSDNVLITLMLICSIFGFFIHSVFCRIRDRRKIERPQPPQIVQHGHHPDLND